MFCAAVTILVLMTWQNLPEDAAMANAEELIRGYVLAGFAKIHIDTSMRVASDDQNARLRTVRLHGAAHSFAA